MYFELWAVHSGNLVAKVATEVEALQVVRGLLAAGWQAEDLLLGAEPDTHESEDLTLPPVLAGPALRARAVAYA